jgi:hypothetical protein
MAVASGDPVARELVSERVSTLMEGTVRAMIATKMKMILGIAFLVAALLGLGLGRLTLGAADAAPGDKKASAVPTIPVSLIGAAAGKDIPASNGTEQPKADAVPAGPGNDLIVRRPTGSFTREVPSFGKATVTFTENRIHVVVTLRIEKETFTVTLDADYALNRESIVYGVITSVDLTGLDLDSDNAEFIPMVMSSMTDTPFSFRVRVEDDALMVKDIKWGAVGSVVGPSLIDNKEIMGCAMQIVTMAAGKYKADPNPERNTPLTPVRPKKK